MVNQQSMSKAALPNTFIIGVQKAGTTTLDDWLAQHPQIYCYESLKDVLLFARFNSMAEITQRMQKEPAAYKNEPVVLQSAVNYIFYPQYLAKLAEMRPDAKLLLILRNPLDRAVSSYGYFTKMLRENRGMEEALIYKPSDSTEFSRDNSDFTYIEHGLYAKQIKSCLQYFPKEQLLVLDYDELATNPKGLLQRIYTFLNIEAFEPDLTPKNVTGSVKSQTFQDKLVNRSNARKWFVDKIIDPIFPVGKRKMLKKKLFEMNTGKKQPAVQVKQEDKETVARIKKQLKPYFIEDAKELDALLGTSFYEQWFEKKLSTVKSKS